MFGSHQFFDLGIFGDQRWIRGLSIKKAKELDGGQLGDFTAIRRASSFDSIFATNRRPGQSDKKVT